MLPYGVSNVGCTRVCVQQVRKIPGHDQCLRRPKIAIQLARKQEEVTTSMLVCSAPEMGGWVAPPTSSSLQTVAEAFPANQGGVCACKLV